MWKFSVKLLIFTNLNIYKYFNFKPRIFYGGAISGSNGGPQVKMQRLVSKFPQRILNFDMLYILSNYAYLDESDYKKIKKKTLPVVLNQNGIYNFGWYGEGWEKQNSGNKLAYLNADYVFWQSEFAKKTTELFFNDITPLGEILYNAVDLNSFKPIKKNHHHFSFLLAGNFNTKSYYQIEAGIRAFSLVFKTNRKAKLIIAGEDHEVRLMANNLAKDLGIDSNTLFKGKYNQTEAPHLFAQADAYLALKYLDTCPNLVIEALACGVPVVYSSTGGVAELVGMDSGVGIALFEDYNLQPHAPSVKDISQAMEEVMSKYLFFSTNARDRALQKFDLSNWLNRHEQIFEKLRNK